MPPPLPLFGPEVPGGDYEELHLLQDPASGLLAMVCLHDTSCGPGAGGIRRMRYADEEAARLDVLRLAYGMSLKCALAELPAGGAKAVILDHPGLDLPAAYRALGRAVERLEGRYICGPDVGTGEQELAWVREATGHVNPLGNDPNGSTALGVVAGLHGVLEVLEDDRTLSGRSFVVQGLGGVGMAVADALLEAGAHVQGADVSQAARERALERGVDLVDPEQATATPCDVFVPCALGGVITEEVAGALPARAVCGSANNQLATPAAGRALHERGVLYAPDAAVNAGAVIEGVLTTLQGATGKVREQARARIRATEDRLVDLLEAAQARGEPPEVLASRRAGQRLGPP